MQIRLGAFQADELRLSNQISQKKSHGTNQDTARATAVDGAVLDDRHRLSCGRNQRQGILSRRGSGALRRTRHGLVRAEVGAVGDGRNAGARALPLWRGRAIRNAVLHRANESRRASGEHDRADRRADSRCGEPRLHEDDGPQTRARAGIVRWFGNQHGRAAGGGRDARQRRSRSRLLGCLPVRRGRADPVPLHRLHLAKAEDPSAHGHRPGASRNRRAQSGTVRQVARRADDRIARRGADRRAAPGGPQRAGFAQLRHRRK